MEFILADTKKKEVCFLEDTDYLDIDIGKTDDFVLKKSLKRYEKEKCSSGYYLFCPKTEYGGRIYDPEIDTKNGTISFTGDTFRGMLKKKIICPPKGEDYYSISGEYNRCIDIVLKQHFGENGLFRASSEYSGGGTSYFRFDRYCSVLAGLEKLLKVNGYRLKLECVQEQDDFYVEVSAVLIMDYSEEIETSQDCDIFFTIKQYTNKYDYMIALGKGELSERTVILLHCDVNTGEISVVSEIPSGEEVKVYLYDYSNCESEGELRESAKEKFREINHEDSQKMTLPEDMEAEVGDIVGGRDYITGMYVTQKISGKIIKIQNGIMKISVTVGED